MRAGRRLASLFHRQDLTGRLDSPRFASLASLRKNIPPQGLAVLSRYRCIGKWKRRCSIIKSKAVQKSHVVIYNNRILE
ncbi:hypothetical protein E2C01_012870 [Portunus trituberculatus]|uniref:Uncharacterized protein n=1 Tax=Portunus trituberculatus TaxID=210409 RepID=A0A5B7DEU3_PORTR|nr:hypothetical protein [Portunus trituberculatus]